MSKDVTPLPEAPKDRPAGCLVRLFWMVAGYLILIFAAVSLWNGRVALSVSGADLAYWIGVAAMIAARYADVVYLGGKTSDGEKPATLADWRRYSLVLVSASLAIWLLLHAANFYRG